MPKYFSNACRIFVSGALFFSTANAATLTPIVYDDTTVFASVETSCELQPNATTDQSAKLQTCIDITRTGGVLEIPAGTYILSKQVIVRKAITIKTKNLATSAQPCLSIGISCARLKAAANQEFRGGFLNVKNTASVVVDHVVLDGNRSSRGNILSNCYLGIGYNSVVQNCDNCTFTNSASINAACGTGMEWWGNNATITKNTFRDNGSRSTGYWSDGLTVHYAHNSTISGNSFVDNSDVDFIIGNGRNTLISGNAVSHSKQASFAGFMLHTWAYSVGGDFTGAVVENNTVSCSKVGCHFGFELGSHPWDPALGRAFGATIRNNTVTGWEVGINIDGFGVPGNAVVLSNNSVTNGVQSSFCGNPPTHINVNTSHALQTGLAAGSYTTYAYDGCAIAP